MPRLSRYFLRLSLVYMLLGFTLGAMLLAQKGVSFAPWLWALLPYHVDFLLVGWMSQFALGVAFWILPRLGGEHPRGREGFSWAAFFLVNAGLWISLFFPLRWLGRLLSALGVVLFISGNWPRLYPPPWA